MGAGFGTEQQRAREALDVVLPAESRSKSKEEVLQTSFRSFVFPGYIFFDFRVFVTSLTSVLDSARCTRVKTRRRRRRRFSLTNFIRFFLFWDDMVAVVIVFLVRLIIALLLFSHGSSRDPHDEIKKIELVSHRRFEIKISGARKSSLLYVERQRTTTRRRFDIRFHRPFLVFSEDRT